MTALARLLRRIRDLFRAPTPDTGLDEAAHWQPWRGVPELTAREE